MHHHKAWITTHVGSQASERAVGNRHPGLESEISLRNREPYCRSQYELAAIERFCIAAVRVALHSPQPHERKKCVLLEPSLRLLRFEGFHQIPALTLSRRGWKRNENVRSP